jgi:hypothetical protein
MWLEMHSWWEEMIVLARPNGIPVIFAVHDVEGTAATEVLLTHVEELARRHENVFVSRLTSERFGLDTGDREALRRTIRETLTLGRDPHGNVLQHALVARAILEDGDRRGWIERLRGTVRASLPR